MLYNRVIGQGTINEPKGKPTPEYALQSTVSWMKAVRMLSATITFESSSIFYQAHGRREMGALVENTVLEQLFLSLHHLSALATLTQAPIAADVARIGILAWYYGISNAASAMIAAQNGSFQEDHSGTAKMWDSDIAARELALPPFSWRVSTLVEKNYAVEVDVYRAGSNGSLQWSIGDIAEATGAAASYLSGTAKWSAWKVEETVKESQEFKALGATNFRTKAARELRDAKLSRRNIGFVHEASRYRGKANYREALFLAYGHDTETKLQGYLADQARVLSAFLSMAGAFCRRKLGKATWSEFIADVEANRAFSQSAMSVWGL